MNTIFRQKKKRQTSRMTEIWNHVSVTFKLDIFLKSQSWEVCERALLNFGLPFETTDLSLEKSKPFLSKNIALSLNWWFRERHKKCHIPFHSIPFHIPFGLPFKTTDLSMEKSKPFLSKKLHYPWVDNFVKDTRNVTLTFWQILKRYPVVFFRKL